MVLLAPTLARCCRLVGSRTLGSALHWLPSTAIDRLVDFARGGGPGNGPRLDATALGAKRAAGGAPGGGYRLCARHLPLDGDARRPAIQALGCSNLDPPFDPKPSRASVALVQAEGDGVVMVPLTVDNAVIDLLLDSVQPGSLPTPGTELRPSLERALGLFVEDGDKHRSIIVVSDGEDHGSGLERSVQSMKERGVTVHAIGVGTPEGKPLEMPAVEVGQPLEYKRDEDGQVVVSRLQEQTLESLSRETGGLYIRATSAAASLERLVQRIEAMEKRSFGSEMINSLEERFQWPIALAILALVLHLGLSPFRREDPQEEGA